MNYRVTMALSSAAAVAFGWQGGTGAATANPAHFTYTLDRPAVVSAGVFDSNGHLVRTLWTERATPAGKQSGDWDGKDDMGQAAPTTERYVYRVIANRATYVNVGAIGNSGMPPNTAGHIPQNMDSVAVDATGAVYTANGWDEAGADFKSWDADGHSRYDAHFQIRNGQPNGAPYSVATDDQYLYCGVGGWAGAPWNEQQEIQRFRLSDGQGEKFPGVDRPDGHILVHEWPSHDVPATVARGDAAIMVKPLRAIAVAGDDLLVVDALSDRIRRYDKHTGLLRGEFEVKFPQAIAVAPDGRIYVGYMRHLIAVFRPDGTKERDVLSDLGDVKALSFAPDGTLYAADAEANQVKIYNVSDGAHPVLLRTIGRHAVPGDRAADRFFQLRGVAVDKRGDAFTIQTEPYSGARLAKWAAGTGQLLWEQYGIEFATLGNYDASDPDSFYTMSLHHYRLLDREKGTWEYLGNSANWAPTWPVYHGDGHGAPRVLHFGGHEFLYTPTGDGVQIYRVEGNVLHLASLIGGSVPSPKGPALGTPPREWTWSDSRGTVFPQDKDIVWRHTPPADTSYQTFGLDVDANGDIWYAERNSRAIWTLPRTGLDARGNPTYNWDSLRYAIPHDDTSLGFDPDMAQHASDGTVYAIGWSNPWPSPPNNPFWMGGTTLARFDAKGTILWATHLPGVCVGVDVIPGKDGGCMVGAAASAVILHYSGDGLLIGEMKPGAKMGNQSGWLDGQGAVAVNRSADGALEVFAEDDLVGRVAWYRVSAKGQQVLTGRIENPLR